MDASGIIIAAFFLPAYTDSNMKLIKPALFLFSWFFIFNTSTAQSSGLPSENHTNAGIEKVYLQTDRDYYFLGDTIWYKAYLLDGKSLSPLSDLQNLYIELIDTKGTTSQSQVSLCEYGLASGYILISDTSATGPSIIRAYTDYQKNFGEELFFHKSIRISKVKNSFEIESDNSALKNEKQEIDVSFFPEGGFLLTGSQNIIAFKALDQTGLGKAIKGMVLNSKGDGVVAFRTDYKGMGHLFFTPEMGESYEVIIDGFPGFTYRFEDIRSEAIKLVLHEQNPEELTLRIISNSRKRSRDPYYVACFSRDSLLFSKEIKDKRSMRLKIDTDVMLAGVNRLVLLNEKLEPVSERMVFIKNNDICELEINTNQEEFATRSPVQVDIHDDLGTLDSAYSSLSVTVVDENALIAGGVHQHMASYLFLDSELKGYIESPADYFVDNVHISSKDKLNLLMLTHGWSNYLEDFPDASPEDFKYQKTAGINLEGYAERYVGKKPLAGGAITVGLFTVNGHIFLEGITDSSGRFSIENQIFYDTATVFAQVLNEKGKQRSEVSIDTEIKINPAISPQLLNAAQHISEISLQHYRQKYQSDAAYREFLSEEEFILLEGVEVKGTRGEKDDGHFRIYSEADDVLKVKESDYHYLDILHFLQGRVAGLSINGNQIRLRGMNSMIGGSTPLFVLDGMPIGDDPLSIVRSIPMLIINKVEILKGARAAIYGSRGNNGVIAIYTKTGEVITQERELIGAITKKVVGVSSNREFYSQKYTPENIESPVPDHRTTLFWNPDFTTEKDRPTLSFYTADDLGYYRIIVEGISEEGQVCYGSARFMVNSHH